MPARGFELAPFRTEKTGVRALYPLRHAGIDVSLYLPAVGVDELAVLRMWRHSEASFRISPKTMNIMTTPSSAFLDRVAQLIAD